MQTLKHEMSAAAESAKEGYESTITLRNQQLAALSADLEQLQQELATVTPTASRWLEQMKADGSYSPERTEAVLARPRAGV